MSPGTAIMRTLTKPQMAEQKQYGKIIVLFVLFFRAW